VRICVIGKFPPIQGGVSMRTYWSAHGLAARGHEVHVVTNAKEVEPPFRMHMRPEDWHRCEAGYEGAGSVTVHWTDPVDRSQSYIPMASPFVSKLAATAASAHAERPFDVIFSFYMEPYGVAGYLAAQMTGVPHVVRMAGSDAGRLWRHPQLECLYDHVLRSAEAVVAGGVVAERAFQRGVDPGRIALGGGFSLPEDLFVPGGPTIDLAKLRVEVEQDPDLRAQLWGGFTGDRTYFGIYGKLGEKKGSFALLAAMHQLLSSGMDVGLLVMAHGPPEDERRFRAAAQKLGLAQRILQIPFLPHWRVPEFLRSCLAVCCLEQDFPIVFHNPIIPREVLLCGACLIGSLEVIKKLPASDRLPHGYGCVAIEDVNDTEALSRALAAVVRDPEPLAAIRERGRAFALGLQSDAAFPERLERILEAASARRRAHPTKRENASGPEMIEDRFALTRLAAALIARASQGRGETKLRQEAVDLSGARDVLATVNQLLGEGCTDLAPLVPAIEIEIAIATAESEAGAPHDERTCDPIFRLRMRRWAMTQHDLTGLVPLRCRRLRLLSFDYDVAQFMRVRTLADLPKRPTLRSCHVAVFGASDQGQRGPLLVDAMTARILELSDGTRTVAEIVGKLAKGKVTEQVILEWIESLFVRDLISLREAEPRSGGCQTAQKADHLIR
jgi:glycosyltransferase involved in cell wall biosynthesis